MPNLSSRSPIRLLLFLLATCIIAALLLIVPAQLQRLSFALTLFVALAVRFNLLSLIRKLIRPFQSIYQAHSLSYAQLSFVITVILLGLSSYYYQSQFYETAYGFYLFLLSLVFLRLSFPLLPACRVSTEATHIPSSKIRWIWLGLSLICMIVLSIMNAPKLWVAPYAELLTNSTAHAQMLILSAGILTLLYGFGLSFLPRRFTWERHHTILAGILLIAIVMRFWNLEETIRMFMDEFHFIKGLITIQVNSVQILYPSSNAFTDIFSYFQFIFKSLMGANLTVLRLPSAIFGVLAVVGLYRLARELFSLRVALLSALLLAVMPAHVHFSRIGINNIAGATLAIWSFAYLLRGMRRQELVDFALAGVLLGLTHYFYEGDRLFFTAFTLAWLLWMSFFCRRNLQFPILSRKQFMVFIFCLLMLIAPLYHSFWSHKYPFASRFNSTHDSNLNLKEDAPQLLVNSVGTALQHYVQSEANDSFYQSEYAYVLPMTVPFFLLGLGILLWRIFTASGSLLVWWLLGIVFANSLILDSFSAASPRYVAVYAGLMLITALGIDTLWTGLEHWFGARWKRLIQVGLIIFITLMSVYQMDYYFGSIVPNFYRRVFTRVSATGRNRPAHDDMMLRALSTLADNTSLYVFTSLPFPGDLIKVVPFYYGRGEDIKVVHEYAEALTDDYFADLPHDRNYVFTFTAYHAPIIEMIRKTFVITKIEGSPYDIPADVEMKFYFASFIDD